MQLAKTATPREFNPESTQPLILLLCLTGFSDFIRPLKRGKVKLFCDALIVS